jgi:regulator of replication initiation timing
MGAVARVEVMLDERRVPTEGILMAQIMVVADDARDLKQTASAMRERVTVADLESEHFRRQLLERVGWAVEDTEVERTSEQ